MEAPGLDLKQEPGKGPKLLWANTGTQQGSIIDLKTITVF